MNPLLTSSLLTALLQSSLLVTGAWLLILTQRKASAARRSVSYRFTMAAAILLLAATLGHTALSLTPDRHPDSIPAALPQGAGFIAENTLLNPSENLPVEKPSPSPSVSSIANSTSSGPLLLSAAHTQWLGAIWLTGAALVLTAWLRSLAARLSLLRRSENATGAPWLEAAREVKGWPLVDEVRLVPQEITPCVWGARKSVLALPASAPAWPAAKLKLVLAHECAHLLRRDPLWQILSRCFLALLWFHPLAWNLARRSQAADEQAADDTVLRTACDAPSYAGLLVECARQFSLPPALQPTASAMASPTNLTRRVEAVLNPAADRRPVSFTSLLTWAAAITFLTAISSYAAPEISTAPEQETQAPNPEPQLAKPDDQPLFPSITPAPKPEFKVSSDSIIFPPATPAARKTFILKGSAKIHAHDFTISADEMTLQTDTSKEQPIPGETIDPISLKSIVASGSVIVEGKIDGVVLSAKADSVSYTKNGPAQDIILTGWPLLKTDTNLIEGNEQDAKIIIGPKAAMRVEKCRISTVSKRSHANKTAGQSPNASDTPQEINPRTEPFAWKPVSLNGLDYLSGHQMKDFYQFSDLFKLGSSGRFELLAWKMNIKGTMGTNDILINGVRLLLKHPVLSSEGWPMISRQDLSMLLDPVIRPGYNESPKNITTVVIDPGHGGNDTGATSPQGAESTLTLEMALRLKAVMEGDGLKVVLTRQDDSRIELEQRAEIAAAEENALLISLHFSHDKDPSRQGLRTFFPDGDALGADAPDYLKDSIRLAVAVHANCLSKMRPYDGGVQEANFAALRRQTKTPAILIEGGYLSHPGEAARINTEAYRQSFAEAIAGGVQNYIRARNQGKNPAPAPK